MDTCTFEDYRAQLKTDIYKLNYKWQLLKYLKNSKDEDLFIFLNELILKYENNKSLEFFISILKNSSCMYQKINCFNIISQNIKPWYVSHENPCEKWQQEFHSYIVEKNNNPLSIKIQKINNESFLMKTSYEKTILDQNVKIDLLKKQLENATLKTDVKIPKKVVKLSDKIKKLF